jgi:dTDP-4-amino-4,6-dideoxygalactose transaminase
MPPARLLTSNVSWVPITMRKIPLIKPELPPFAEIAGPFREALESGKITNFGKFVCEFEAQAAAYLGTEVVTVSSGTMGLIMTLQALGLGPGQKVILPSFTFMATAQAILYAGGVPVFAEVRDDLTVCPEDLARLLDRHPDAAGVMPVHTYGLPCQVDEIARVVEGHAKRVGRPVFTLYDAAHAFGTSQGGRKVGGFGDAEVFSLSVTKVLVSVEGGMISTRDARLAHHLRKMRNYGIEEAYNAYYPGMNGKMSEFHAIVGLHNLRRLDGLLAERQRKARYFLNAIQQKTRLGTFPSPEGVVHTFKDFTVLVPDGQAGRRDAIMAYLKERGVETRAYFFPPVHEQKFFRGYADRPLPRTEGLSRRVITLPFYATITEPEMDYTVSILAEAERKIA